MAALLIQLVVILIVVGVLLWAVNRYVPMEPSIKNILNLVVIVALVLYVGYALIQASRMIA